jgi:hypothetical protein
MLFNNSRGTKGRNKPKDTIGDVVQRAGYVVDWQGMFYFTVVS